MHYVILLFLICALFALPFLRKTGGNEKAFSPKPQSRLDAWGIITNVILGVLYIPISVIGCFMGMVGEGYMYDPTALQSFLCDTIMLVGIFTPLVSFCGIVTSVLHRRRGRSGLSFFIQFSGIIAK